MTLIIGSARHDERGRYNGGKNGDQSGTEVSTQTYYVHPKGWLLIRAKSAETADNIAKAMLEACNNKNIGYDQYDRNIIAKVKKYGSLAKIAVRCDTDCSDLVRACVYQATGRDSGDFYTTTESAALQRLGIFEPTTEVTHTTALYNGDILVTKTKGHTAIVVSGRPRAEQDKAENKTGWVKSGNDWYYRIAPGVNAHGWLTVNHHWYYFDSNGKMLKDWQDIGGKWYYFQPNGDLEGALYRTDESGAQHIWET